MTKKKSPRTIEHTFKKNTEFFIPALLYKYPWKIKFVGSVETTITSLEKVDKKIIIERLKKGMKNVFGKEKFIFDFLNQKIRYFENDMSKKHFETIFYDFKEDVHYKQQIFKNDSFNYFYKFTNYLGNNRMNHLMEKFSKDKKIQELINIDLDFLFK